MENNQVVIRNLTKGINPWLFFLIALGISWTFWLPLIFLEGDPMAPPLLVLTILGGLGPAAAEFFLIQFQGSPVQRRDYFQRIFDIRRIKWQWAAGILVFFPLLNAAATGLSVISGGPAPSWETVQELINQPLSIVPYLLVMFLFGPLPEELGWSGYALDGLQKKHTAAASSLIIGAVWAVWHLPLFFVEGTFQHDQIGFATSAFLWFMLPTLPISILDTWVYNNNHRSTLAAVLVHFMVNLSGELFNLSGRARFYQTILLLLFTAYVVMRWGPEQLKERNPVREERTRVPGLETSG